MFVKSNQLCKSIWCLRIRGWRSGNFVWWIRRARSRSTGAWRWIKTRSHTIHITWKPSTNSVVVVGTKKKTLIETASPTCVYPSLCLLYTYQKQHQHQYYQCTCITLHPGWLTLCLVIWNLLNSVVLKGQDTLAIKLHLLRFNLLFV